MLRYVKFQLLNFELQIFICTCSLWTSVDKYLDSTTISDHDPNILGNNLKSFYTPHSDNYRLRVDQPNLAKQRIRKLGWFF